MLFHNTNTVVNVPCYNNVTIWEVLNNSVIFYQYNMLIYTKSKKNHVGYIRLLVECLVKAVQYLKSEKCKFQNNTVKYLGLNISTNGISIDPNKINIVRNFCRNEKQQLLM